MKVVCIKKNSEKLENWRYKKQGKGSPDKQNPDLEIGKIYEGDLILYNIDDCTKHWEGNALYITGFSKMYWFPVELFIKIEEYRELQLDKIL